MRKSILFSLLSLIAVLAVACGGGNNATGNTAGGNTAGGNTAGCAGGGDGGGETADSYALYKKEGRKWKHKSVTKMEGMDDMVSFTAYEITKLADDHAMQKMTMLDKDGKEMMPPTETKIEFKAAETTTTDSAPKVDVKEEKITVAAGEFDCFVTEVAGTKSWSSKKYPGLTVKMEGATTSMELIEFTE